MQAGTFGLQTEPESIYIVLPEIVSMSGWDLLGGASLVEDRLEDLA